MQEERSLTRIMEAIFLTFNGQSGNLTTSVDYFELSQVCVSTLLVCKAALVQACYGQIFTKTRLSVAQPDQAYSDALPFFRALFMSSISSSSSFIAPVAKRPPYQCNSSQSSSSRSYASRASPSLAFRYQRSGWLPDSDSSDSDSEVSSYPLSQNRKRSLRHVSQRQFRRPRHLRQPVPPLLGGKGGGGREDPALLAARVNMETAQGVFDSTTMNAAFYQGLAVCFTLLATLFLLVAWQVDAVALLTLPTKKGDNATISKLSIYQSIGISPDQSTAVAISDPMTSIPDSFLAYLQGNSFIAFGITWISIIGASTSLLASICICYGSNIRKAMPNGLKSFMSGHADRAHQLLHRILNGSGTFSKYGSLGIKLWWIFFLGLPTFAAAAFHALAFLDQMRSLSSATAGGKELDGRIAYVWFLPFNDGTDVVQIWPINTFCMCCWHTHVSRFYPRSSVSGVQSLTTQCTRRIGRVSAPWRFQRRSHTVC